MRNGGRDVVWSWDGGVRGFTHTAAEDSVARALGAGGPLGLLVISVVAGVVSGVAEALGLFRFVFFLKREGFLIDYIFV